LGKALGAVAGSDATVHGLRSAFRDWADEMDMPDAVAEACLAHARGNAVERAYARSDLLDRRRKAMDEWAAFVRGESKGGKKSPSRADAKVRRR
jgi:integrase